MSYLTREDLLGADSVPIEEVRIDALGGRVRVRGMTGTERDAYEQSCIQGRGRKRDINMKGMRAKMVSLCCVDERGDRLFTEQDVERLGRIRADVIDVIFGVAQRLSGMREEDVEELGQPSESPTTSDTFSSPLPLSSG